MCTHPCGFQAFCVTYLEFLSLPLYHLAQLEAQPHFKLCLPCVPLCPSLEIPSPHCPVGLSQLLWLLQVVEARIPKSEKKAQCLPFWVWVTLLGVFSCPLHLLANFMVTLYFVAE